MSEHPPNVLSSARNAGATVPDHVFGLFFTRHVRGLYAAEHHGIPIDAPGPVVAYMRRFQDRVLKALSRSNPSNRRRSLESEVKNFRSLKGWRAEFPGQAEACALALDAVAADLKRPIGRRRDSAKSAAHRYVRRAFEDLIVFDLSCGRPDRALELFEPGIGDKPSRGRLRVTEKTFQLAEADGVHFGLAEVGEYIRRYVKVTPTPIFNALIPRKAERQPARPLIRAAGM